LPCELADLLSISRATVTRALDGLEAKQWIIRKKSTKDRRESSIFATLKAKAVKHELDEAGARVTARLKQQLDASVFTESVTRLKSIREAIG
jgi:DNA-binding MarR family transcriptional regulator